MTSQSNLSQAKPPLPPATVIETAVQMALAEDIGSGDLSAPLLTDTPVRAQLYCREPAVVCGQAWFDACFHLYEKMQNAADTNANAANTAANVEWIAQEGEWWNNAERPLATVFATAKTVLAAERSALNFLQTLSATATAAHQWQRKAGSAVCAVDTRKTLPLLRAAQKYAVRVGGAHNHRHALDDEILIKENHLAASGLSISDAIARAHQICPPAKVQVEVQDAAGLAEAVAAGATRILLDNFSTDAIAQAVASTPSDVELEASGGITLSTLPQVAASGVARISVGAMTKNIRAIDYTLLIE